MRRRPSTPSLWGAVRRLIPVVLLALPGGEFRAYLPGIMVDDQHQWASVCDDCDKVKKTSIARVTGARCEKHGPCRNLQLTYCKAAGCGKILVYEPNAEPRRGPVCRGGSHHPEPRFTGKAVAGKSREYVFSSGRSR